MPPALHQSNLKTFQDPPGSEMVTLPRGHFVMGTVEDDIFKLLIALGRNPVLNKVHDEEPAHLVQINYDFAIARCCVTFDEYDAYARLTGAQLPDDAEGGRGNRPVVCVSWHDAKRYVKWLDDVTGRPYRLPSEAEWEYSARAGTNTQYWWGNMPDIGNANYDQTPGCDPFSVDSLEPNPWGLYNMNGNVNEWVEDCFHKSYFGAPADGSAWISDYTWSDPKQEWVRVLRGGDFWASANEIRSSYRGWMYESDRFLCNGFRVALTMANS